MAPGSFSNPFKRNTCIVGKVGFCKYYNAFDVKKEIYFICYCHVCRYPMEQVENFVQGIEDKVKSDLQSSILANGKIKAGRRTSYKFDKDVISELRQLKEKLVCTRSKLTDLGRKVSNLFQVDFGAFKRKSRSKKQNKHRAAKRKAMRTSQRTSEVMKKIAPGLDEDSRCEKRHIVKELVFKLNKREKKWLELLVCQHDTTQLSSDARDYLSSLLGKNGGNTATSTSTYHGDDNEDVEDDLNYDDDDHDHDGDDDGYDDDDDCSVFEAASRISPVQENSSDDDYGPYWDNSPTCTPYLDHVSD